MLREYAAEIGLPALAPHDLRRYAECDIIVARAPGYATPRAVSLSRSSFCWGTSPWRQLKDTWAASNTPGRGERQDQTGVVGDG
jgi:hypothetical protein